MLIGASGGGGDTWCVVLNGVTKECKNKDTVSCLELTEAKQHPLYSRFALLDPISTGVKDPDCDYEVSNDVTKKCKSQDTVSCLELIKAESHYIHLALLVKVYSKHADVEDSYVSALVLRK